MSEPTYLNCIAACNACADACDRCLSACLLETDTGRLVRCIALDLECAALCRLLAGYAARGSKFAPGLAALCATVCAACAGECESHEQVHCQACAKACRDCEQVCRRLADLPVEPPAAAAAAAA